MVNITGITGGKGGTGKSSIATALAYQLSKYSKVLLVDADVDCPNDHLLLSIKRHLIKDVTQRVPYFDMKRCTRCSRCAQVCRYNAIVAIKGKDPIFMSQQCNGCGSCEFVCPSNAISWDQKEIGKIYKGRILSDTVSDSGTLKDRYLDLLSGDLKTNEILSEFIVDSLNQIIEKKKYDYDHIIIDTAAGTHCPVIAALDMCDKVLCVTEPTPLGKHDLDLILELLKKLDISSNIVINRSDIGDNSGIISSAKSYGSDIICKVPYSKDIVDSYSKGEPIKDKSILDLAKVIL